MNLFPIGKAIISNDNRHRYMLERKTRVRNDTEVLWIGLNPSIADAHTDDPTLRRILKFSEDWGYGAIKLANLYSLISTDPALLGKAEDAVGQNCDAYIKQAMGKTDLVVVCWGASLPPGGERRAADVLKLLRAPALPIHCLGTTQAGHPRHPLYLVSTTKLEVYNG